MNDEGKQERWEAYNARALSADEVAATFIPPDEFLELTSPDHHLVVGPRGSGKTTLLKMLQPRALAAWDHPDAPGVRERVAFTGVFVPADRTWSAQIRALDGTPARPGTPGLAEAAFTTHVLRSLVRAMLDRQEMAPGPHTEFARVSMSKEEESTVAETLAGQWMLEGGVPSLRGLRQLLTTRLSHLWRLARRAGRQHEPQSELPDWVDLDYMQEVVTAVELFNDVTERRDERWALLFDELELAPERLRRELVTDIRLPDTRILLKLALAPYPNVAEAPRGPDAPSAGHDYRVVALSYSERTDLTYFSKRLLNSWLQQRGWKGASIESLFGPARVDTPTAEWLSTGTAYSPGSARHKSMLRYVRTDKSVLRYLEKEGIALERMGEVSPGKRAAVLRKIAPLVALREHYLEAQPSQSGRHLRTRKTYDFYTGLSHILAVAEGNPRTLLSLVRPMLTYVDGAEGSIPRHIQARGIAEAIARYRSFLRTIAVPSIGPDDGTRTGTARRGLLELLDSVGNYFAGETLGRRFNPDPPGSILVDAAVPVDLLANVGAALNAGALIFVPDKDSTLELIFDPRGKRFRLNYLLAAYYHLPLRLGRPLSLSRVLEGVSGDPTLFSHGGTEEGNGFPKSTG